MADSIHDPDFAILDEPFGDLIFDETVSCRRCGQPIPLKSFRLPPKLCDKCRETAEHQKPKKIAKK